MTTPPTAPAPGTLAWSYLRFSSKPQERGQSIERQTQLAQKYADDHRLKLDTRTFADLGVSAFRQKNLQAGSALHTFVAAVEAGKVKKGSVLLIEQLDRWSRAAPLDALNSLQRVLRHGIGIVTLTDRRYWTMQTLKNLNDLLSAILTMSRSHEESVAKSDRLRSVWASKRARVKPGTLHTRSAPGWLSWDDKAGVWRVDQSKARIVLRVFQLAAEGHGVESIAKKMNREKMPPPTRRGTTWHGSTPAKLLNNLAVIGTLQVGHRETREDGRWRRVVDQEVENYYPAIVSKRLWVKTRRQARPQPPPGPKSINLFSSLLVCGVCKGKLHLFNRGNGHGRYLVCITARRGLCDSARGWEYERMETLLVTLLHRCIQWGTLVPRQRNQRTATLARLEEKLATVEVDRQANTLKLQRITEAIEAGAKVSTLIERMKLLEGQRETFDRQAEEVRAQVEAERERVRTASVDAGEAKAAFVDWTKGKLKNDPTARHRLSVVLHRMLDRLILTTTENGRGPATEARKVEVVFRDEDERPERFYVTPNLLTVMDEEGEEVVRIGD
jgi:DNA invertase Pin-like site-specific DNA recombinase